MSIRYVIKEGFAGIWRTRLAAFTSMFSLFVAVFLIGVLARVGFNAYEVAQSLRQQVEIEVFLLDLDNQSTNDLRRELEGSDLVENISYISSDSASAIFQREFGLGSESLAQLDFLPASFRLVLVNDTPAEEVEQLVTEIAEYRGVDEVKFNMALLQMIESRIELTAMIGGGLGALILFVAIVLVFNTIRLTIYAKRDLIRAMKLVGATNAFIRRPFLVEGLLQGLFAGGVACLLLFFLFATILPSNLPQVGILDWPFGEWYYLTTALMVLSLAMGWWGSRWASRKFIRDTKVYG